MLVISTCANSSKIFQTSSAVSGVPRIADLSQEIEQMTVRNLKLQSCFLVITSDSHYSI